MGFFKKNGNNKIEPKSIVIAITLIVVGLVVGILLILTYLSYCIAKAKSLPKWIGNTFGNEGRVTNFFRNGSGKKNGDHSDSAVDSTKSGATMEAK
jgi:hypothetical protein